MCAVSVIYDYGNKITSWSDPIYKEFKKLIEAAKEFDKVTNQPDCVDPEKEKLIDKIEEQLKLPLPAD